MTKSLTLLKTRFEAAGGAEKYARHLAQAFHDQGCSLTVLTTGPITQSYPFSIISQTLKSKTSVSKLWEFENFCESHLKSQPTDTILGLDRNRFQTHLRASSGVHKAYLRHRRHYDPLLKRFAHILNPLHSSLLHFEKTAIEHPDLQILFTNSELVRSEILDSYIVDPDKIHVVHNGVEWKAFEEPFKKTPYDRVRYEFLFIGSGFERKGLRPLLSALDHLGDDVHLSVVGHDKHLKQYEQAFKKKVTFHGAQSDITPFLQKADCLVIPSYYDPFANVTVEALAMGLFVISSKLNGGHEVLTPETGAIIEDMSSTDSIVTALRRALLRPKTKDRAKLIRETVRYLDFSTQLDSYIKLCLSPTYSSV